MGKFLTPYVLLTALALAGCQKARPVETRAAGATVVVEEEPGWAGIVTDEDKGRLGRLDSAWSQALGDARRAGFTRAIAEEGRLLDPAAKLPRSTPAPGSYKCRVLKLGAPGRKARAFQSFPPFFCYIGVDGDVLAITKQTGSERPGGFLWDDRDPLRMIFLGSLALGNEETPAPYGENPARDMAGVFERVGPFRYRLVIPWPREEAKLIVIELTPSPVQPDEG